MARDRCRRNNSKEPACSGKCAGYVASNGEPNVPLSHGLHFICARLSRPLQVTKSMWALCVLQQTRLSACACASVPMFACAQVGGEVADGGGEGGGAVEMRLSCTILTMTLQHWTRVALCQKTAARRRDRDADSKLRPRHEQDWTFRCQEWEPNEDHLETREAETRTNRGDNFMIPFQGTLPTSVCSRAT